MSAIRHKTSDVYDVRKRFVDYENCIGVVNFNNFLYVKNTFSNCISYFTSIMVVLEGEAGDAKLVSAENDKEETKSSPLLSLESILFTKCLIY